MCRFTKEGGKPYKEKSGCLEEKEGAHLDVEEHVYPNIEAPVGPNFQRYSADTQQDLSEETFSVTTQQGTREENLPTEPGREVEREEEKIVLNKDLYFEMMVEISDEIWRYGTDKPREETRKAVCDALRLDEESAETERWLVWAFEDLTGEKRQSA